MKQLDEEAIVSLFLQGCTVQEIADLCDCTMHEARAVIIRSSEQNRDDLYRIEDHGDYVTEYGC